MRESIKTIFKGLADNIENSTVLEHDLRRVVTTFFEKFVSNYIFGRNVSDDTLYINVVGSNGSFEKKTIPVLEAFDQIVVFGI